MTSYIHLRNTSSYITKKFINETKNPRPGSYRRQNKIQTSHLCSFLYTDKYRVIKNMWAPTWIRLWTCKIWRRRCRSSGCCVCLCVCSLRRLETLQSYCMVKQPQNSLLWLLDPKRQNRTPKDMSLCHRSLESRSVYFVTQKDRRIQTGTYTYRCTL
jgi:hypothetical protein